MRVIKGCGNESCEAHKRKITYKETETFCSKCGKKLVFVCKDCYTQLPNDDEKYCVRCNAKHEDRKDEAKKVATKVGGVVIAVGSVVGGVVYKYGKKAVNIARIFKG